MAVLRKGKCYRRIKRAYTRKSKFKEKSYIRTVPNLKIVKYDMGDVKKDYTYRVDLISKQSLQVRHNALESCRTVINRRLHDGLGANYHLKIMVYPHHFLRENKMLAMAHADRLQKGMQKAFGKTIGAAAQIKKGHPLFSVFVDKEGVKLAKLALESSPPRLPGKYSVGVKQIR